MEAGMSASEVTLTRTKRRGNRGIPAPRLIIAGASFAGMTAIVIGGWMGDLAIEELQYPFHHRLSVLIHLLEAGALDTV
jgi:hypothetical protein